MSKLELKFTLCRNFIIIWQLRYYIPKLTKFWYHKSFLCPKIECPQSNCQRVWRVRGGSELKFTLCRNFIIIWQLRYYIPKLTKFWYHKSFLCPKIECPQSNCQRVWRVRGGSELKFTLCRNFIIIWQWRHYSKTHKILIPSIIFVFENRVSPIQLSVSMEGGGRFRATLKHSPVKNLFLQIICS